MKAPTGGAAPEAAAPAATASATPGPAAGVAPALADASAAALPNPGSENANAAKQTTSAACITRIHQRLLRTTSTSGLQRGFITHGRYSNEVRAASEALSMPRRLNMVTDTTFTRKYGIPSKK